MNPSIDLAEQVHHQEVMHGLGMYDGIRALYEVSFCPISAKGSYDYPKLDCSL